MATVGTPLSELSTRREDYVDAASSIRHSGDGDDDDPEAHNSSRPSNYAHGFWDKDVADLRKTYLTNIARITAAVTVLIWAVVIIYWGSLWKSTEKTPDLVAYVVNRDGTGPIGNNLTSALLATNDGAVPHLTWSSIAPGQLVDDAAVERAVAVDQRAWILVDIMQDASARLQAARANADASWSPKQVVRVFYSEARNQEAVDEIILTAARMVVTTTLVQINQASLSQWLLASGGGAANTALLTSLAQSAPQTLTNAIDASYINLRPWTQPVATAPTFVGLIYAMIVAFNVTMGNFATRQPIQRRLRLSSFIAMRLFVPMLAYFVLSAMYSMINLPFHVNFDGLGYGYGAGFMIWWCFTFLGMTVLGLWTEAAISLIGPQFIGFALVFILIINVSVATIPIPLQVSLFKYGYAMPFYNLRQAYVSIIYNTGRHVDLLKYMGILLAWLVLLVLTLPVWIWIERKKERKAEASSQKKEH